MENQKPPEAVEDDKTYQKSMLAIGKQLIEQKSVQTSDRRVANVGEYTQSVIAVFVVVTMCYGVVLLHEVRMPPEFWTIVGLVIGFYFGRNRPLGTLATQQRPPDTKERASDKK